MVEQDATTWYQFTDSNEIQRSYFPIVCDAIQRLSELFLVEISERYDIRESPEDIKSIEKE